MYQEKIIVGEGTPYPLNGLLTFPDGMTGPVPAAVFVHGSGPSNMDEKVMKLTPFRDLAGGLAGHGIASLRYDKRTFVHARRMIKGHRTVTVWEETVEDALLAVELLKKDRRIDPERIFLLGHSMGAMLAPRIDAEGADVRGLILMAGTPYRLEEKFYSKRFRDLYGMSDDEAKKKKFAGNLTLYYFKEMGRKTAADYLLESGKPALILQGGRDFQVLAEEDFREFRRLLAGRDNVSFRLYPELNHVFVKAIYDDILKASKDYRVERHIGDEVIGDIARFILQTGKAE